MLRAAFLLGLFTLLSSLAGAASAAEATPKSAEPRIHLSVPAPEVAPARTYRMHEGFYLRAAFGYGWLSVDHDYSGLRGDPNLEGAGSGLAADLWVGLGPAPGMAVGAGVSLTQAFSVALSGGGYDAGEHSLLMGLAGPFFDAYPIATQGWHLGGLIGGALFTLDSGGAGGPDSALGFGGAIWGGYDFWVADEWSAGALLRFQAAAGKGSEGAIDVDAAALGIGLTLGVLYN